MRVGLGQHASELYINQLVSPRNASTVIKAAKLRDWSFNDSFFGPGATFCRYSAVASCLLYGSLNLKGRNRKSVGIDNDFIAQMVYVLLSAGHLIIQANNLPSQWQHMPVETPVVWEQKNKAGMEAALHVVDTQLLCCIVLFLPYCHFYLFWRGLLNYLTGLVCLASQFYVLRSLSLTGHGPEIFSRWYLLHFPSLLLAISVLVGALSSYHIAIFVVLRWREHRLGNQYVGHFKHLTKTRSDHLLRLSAWMTVLIIPAEFGICCFSWLFTMSQEPHLDVLSAQEHFFARVLSSVVPPSRSSLRDLGQLAACVARMTILACSVLSAAKSYWNKPNYQDNEMQTTYTQDEEAG